MASRHFTEEPEGISEGTSLLASPDSAPRSRHVLTPEPDSFDLRWDESKWTQGILKQDCIKKSQSELDSRVGKFLAVATDEEKEILASSRKEFQRLVADAVEASKLRDPDTTAGRPSVAARLKQGWSATNAVAYEYVKILDVMVGQAPEYVGLAYGAIKILLVAQVNNEEVKEKVKGYLDQIQLKFQIIDHLTAYMPSSRLVTLIGQAYCLFNVFIAKAIKHYTQPRLRRYLMAFTMPWERFQKIVVSIELKLDSIKDVARYVGLLEGHTTMMVSKQTLALAQQMLDKNEETKEALGNMRLQLDAMSLKFSNTEGVRYTTDSLTNLAEERLNEPTMAVVDNSTTLGSEISSQLPPMDEVEDFDSWRNTLFPELREFREAATRQQRANEELPNMRPYRTKRKGLEKSEMAMAWAESHKSEILWINGNEVLSREDFNASFVRPLVLVGESNFDTVIKLQHFCEENTAKTDPYVVMMQDLVAQVLRQHTSMTSQQKAAITRGRTSTTEGLWDLLLELVSGTDISCVFLTIGGIDHMVAHSFQPGEMRAQIVQRLRALTTDTHNVVKVMVAMGFMQSTTTNVENIATLVRARHPHNQDRRLSMDGLSSAFPGPLMSQHLITIQEGRCRDVSFTEVPLLYPPGTMVYTQDNDILRAFVVSELSGMEPKPFGSFAPLQLRVWSIDHDGRRICRRYRDVVIKYFAGRKNISSLTCVPSGYLPGELTKRKQIVQRGRSYWSYRSGVHYVDVHSQHGTEQGIIDQISRPVDTSLLEGLEPLDIPREAVVKSRFLILSPPDILVYEVRGLTWTSVNLDNLAPMEFHPEALKNLVLADDKKQLLEEAVISSRRKQEHQVQTPVSKMDPHSKITDRLLLLFHGGPGTGKSLAAQCLANYARCPVFVIIPSAMKDDRVFFDRLRTVFQLAKRWNCLVLVDNADTVLARRAISQNVEHNAIITEMLDLIDNYQSIVIMTSNRIGNIDLALVSRIDIAIEFRLDRGARRQIWMNGIAALGDGQQCDDDQSSDDERSSNDELDSRHHYRTYRAKTFNSLAKHPLDGHTIMNILQSASRIARRKGRKIDLEDINNYIESFYSFSGYLDEIYGIGQSSQSLRLRKDDYEEYNSDGEEEMMSTKVKSGIP